MKLIIKHEVTDWVYVGYGETLLKCIYDLSKESLKEDILIDIYEYYAGNEKFYNHDDEFLDDEYNTYIEELPNSAIENMVYRWCQDNNFNYKIEVD